MMKRLLLIAISCLGFVVIVAGFVTTNQTANAVIHSAQLTPRPTLTPTPPKVSAQIGTVLSSIRGHTYLDINRNGKRDAEEQPFSGAWFKVSGGGAWFVCGHVGDDSSYSVPVTAGDYDVVPVQLAGYRPTIEKAHVVILPNTTATDIDLGYVEDANASLESCDQYHPVR